MRLLNIAKNLTSKSLPEIGKSFGNRDHATVIYAVKKEADHREASDTVMRPLLEKTFGQYEYGPKYHMPEQDTIGLVSGDAGGHDLVAAEYKGCGVRFCTMLFTVDESDDDGFTHTREIFTGPCIVIVKDNFISHQVLVTPKKGSKIPKKERVLTEDKEFDSLCAARGESTEVPKILTQSARDKIRGLMQRHKNLTILFESDKIRASYGAGEYFMPKMGKKTARLYEEQLNDLMDIIDTLIGL